MEGKRVLGHRSFWALLGLIVLLQAGMFLYACMKDGGFQKGGKEELYEEELARVMQLEAAEAQAEAEAFRTERQQQAAFAGALSQNPQGSTRELAWEELEKQLAYLQFYPAYLKKIQYEAKAIRSASIFSKPGTVSYENVMKTAADFGSVTADGIDLGHDKAVTAVFRDGIADICVLILIAFVCLRFMDERRRGLWALVHSTRNGRARLALSRVGILLGTAFLSSAFVFGSRILLSCILYKGFGEWGRRLQAIEFFYNVPQAMSVGEFWLFYLIVKALGAFLLGLVIWLILSLISDLRLAVVFAALFLAVEFGLTFLRPSSALVVLRYVNVFSYIRYIRVFTTYLNLPIFGTLINGSTLVTILLVPLCVLFAALSLLLAAKKAPVAATNRLLHGFDTIKRKCMKLQLPRAIFFWEGHKLMVKRLGLLVCLAFLWWASQMDPPYLRNLSQTEAYIQYYAEKYAGPVTEETLKAMAEEAEVSPELNARALRELAERVKRLPEGAQIVSSLPYDAIWSVNPGNYHRQTALLALLFLVLLLAPIDAMEQQDGMRVLLRSTAAGRKKLWWAKTGQCLMLSLLVCVIIYGAEVLHTAEFYGAFRGFFAPMYSLSRFPEASLPLGAALWGYYLQKWIVLVWTAGMIRLLSCMVKTNRAATLLNLFVVVFPAVLLTLGVDALSPFSFLLPLGTVELAGRPWAFVAAAAVGNAGYILSWYLCKRTETGA